MAWRIKMPSSLDGQKSRSVKFEGQHQVHGFENMQFCKVWSRANLTEVEGSHLRKCTGFHCPRQFCRAYVWAKLLALEPIDTPLRTCRSQRAALETSLLPVGYLGAAHPCHCSRCPYSWIFGHRMLPKDLSWRRHPFTCSRWLARWGSAADTRSALWAESRPAFAACDPRLCKERACQVSCCYKGWPPPDPLDRACPHFRTEARGLKNLSKVSFSWKSIPSNIHI